MQNILIITDFSEKWQNAVSYAVELFQHNTCTFYLLYEDENNLVESFNSDENFETVQVKTSVNSKVEIENLIQALKSKSLHNKHHFVSISSEEDIVDKARKISFEKEIDLIIVGTEYLQKKDKTSINVISEEIITKVKCSVLAVPKEAQFTGLEEVVFPTDYTNFYEAKLLENISSFLKNQNSILRFLYLSKNNAVLNKEQQWNKETLKDYFTNQPHSFHAEINQSLETGIHNFTEKFNSALIIVAAKNLNILEQILFRPLKNNLSYYTKLPFLTHF